MNSYKSTRKRKLVYGVGRNDANYLIRPITNGKRIMCPYYKTWMNMLKRCYSAAYQKVRPTYIGCTVVPEWHSFMTFRAWMEAQNWQGNVLDKDILILGNKIYSHKSCIFVPGHINALLADSASARGSYPQGVYLHKQSNKFRAGISIKGKEKHLGLFNTQEAASTAYSAAKSSHIADIANEQTDKRLKIALLNHSKSFALQE